MGIKCYKCKIATKKLSHSNVLVNGKYLVSDITKYACPQCGEEYFDMDEYEKIRKRIHGVEKTSNPLAQAKVVIV